MEENDDEEEILEEDEWNDEEGDLIPDEEYMHE
jgi:hypothetical protein